MEMKRLRDDIWNGREVFSAEREGRFGELSNEPASQLSPLLSSV